MAAPAGIAGQIGIITETTWSTALTVTKFLPFTGEGIKNNTERIVSKGFRAGRRVPSVWKAGAQKIGGSLTVELPNVTVATLLKHMFGVVTTTGAGPFTHTYTPGDLTGDSFTCQVGRPDTAGTVQPFTYAGTKIDSWELSCSVGEAAMLELDCVAATETTGTSLAVASYTASINPFVFTEGSITVAGSAVVTVKKLSLKGTNNLAKERHRLGSAITKEQLENGFRMYGGSLEADFESLAQYNRYVLAQEFALVVAFTSGADSLTFTLNVRYDGETPVVDTEGLLNLPLVFEAISATSDAAACTAVLVNTDSSAA